MKTNTVLFEGIVSDAWESHISDPPSEAIYLKYPLDPINVINVEYNEETGEVEENLVGVNDFGLIQVILPTFNRLKPGDKIKIVKCD